MADEAIPDDALVLVFARLASGAHDPSPWQPTGSAGAAASAAPQARVSPGTRADVFGWVRAVLPLVCKRWHRLLSSPNPLIWGHVVIDARAEVMMVKQQMRAGTSSSNRRKGKLMALSPGTWGGSSTNRHSSSSGSLATGSAQPGVSPPAQHAEGTLARALAASAAGSSPPARSSDSPLGRSSAPPAVGSSGAPHGTVGSSGTAAAAGGSPVRGDNSSSSSHALDNSTGVAGAASSASAFTWQGSRFGSGSQLAGTSPPTAWGHHHRAGSSSGAFGSGSRPLGSSSGRCGSSGQLAGTSPPTCWNGHSRAGSNSGATGSSSGAVGSGSGMLGSSSGAFGSSGQLAGSSPPSPWAPRQQRVRPQLCSDAVLRWVAKRAAAISHCSISLSAYGSHDFDGQRFEGLLVVLRGLRSLRLSGTATEHETYEALGHLRALEVLEIASAPQSLLDTGLLPLSFLPRLARLAIELDITPARPCAALRHFPTRLTHLRLSRVWLEELPPAMAQATGLVSVALVECLIMEDPLPLLLALPRLASLSLAGVPPGGLAAAPWQLAFGAGSSSITRLEVVHGAAACLPADVSRLSSLSSLVLDHNPDMGANPEECLPGSLAVLQHLRHLSLAHCELRELPAVVTQLSALTTLQLQGNSFVSPLPSASPPAFAATLHDLDITSSKLGAFPAFALHCKALRSLAVGSACLEGVAPRVLLGLPEALPQLRLLRVQGDTLSMHAAALLLSLGQALVLHHSHLKLELLPKAVPEAPAAAERWPSVDIG